MAQRGGNVKKAPPGYYTASEAQRKLGFNKPTFYQKVKEGVITQHRPPYRKESYYSKKEIDRMATEMELFLHIGQEESEFETRVATTDDIPGIVDVLHAFGWQTTTLEQRQTWYAVNAFLDYVVLYRGKVTGYIFAAPLHADALHDMMSGKKRAWDLTPHDFYRYSKNHQYDLYVGIATIQETQNMRLTRWISMRLISGFMGFLEELTAQGITVRKMYAVSAEEQGRKLCRKLGFLPQPTQPHDLFPDSRFILDLETSESLFAKKYREAVTS